MYLILVIYFLPTPFFVLCRVMLSVLLLVVRFGHWVCGESWHAIKGSLRLGTWCPAFVCMYVYVCVCVCVCLVVNPQRACAARVTAVCV